MKTFVCLAVVLLLAVAAAAAQTSSASTGEIHGTVFDPNQAVIMGAALTFSDQDAGRDFSAKTNADGAFKMVLPAGYYEVTVRATNFAPARRFVDLRPSSSVLVSVRLEVQGSYDPIVVVDEVEISTSPPGSPRALSEIPQPTPGISVIKFVAPVYPQIARTARIQGDVRVLVEIAPDGSAKRVRVLSGHPMLQAAAMEAVMQWRFGCQRCDEPLYHVLTISFAFYEPDGDPCATDQSARRTVQPELPNRLTVIVDTAVICDPGGIITKTERREILLPMPDVLGAERPIRASPR